MPLYTYNCEACEHNFDEVLPIDDRYKPEGEPCPVCATSGTVKKGIGSPRIVAGVGDFRRKVPDVFKDRLREIKKAAGRTSTIDV